MALDLPADVRDRLAAWRDEAIAGRSDLRPVGPQSLHVTLAFLGYRPEKEIDAISRAVADGAEGHPACLLAPGELKSIPPRRPRLFALDLEDSQAGAARLQADISDALERGRFYTPEKRPFWPHVTVARVKRDQRAEPLAAGVPPLDPFEAADVVLYRSTLRPQGALYEPLAGVCLGRNS